MCSLICIIALTPVLLLENSAYGACANFPSGGQCTLDLPARALVITKVLNVRKLRIGSNEVVRKYFYLNFGGVQNILMSMFVSICSDNLKIIQL